MNTSLKSAIEKIKREEIRPQDRKKYLLEKYSRWAAMGAGLLFAAVSFSVLYFLCSQLDWDLYRYAHMNLWGYVFMTFPFWWVAVLLVFLYASFRNLRKTETGYRYDGRRVVPILVVAVMVLGVVGWSSGLGAAVNRQLEANVQGYGKHIMTKETQWSQPDKGFLAGTVQSISGKTIDITDLQKNDWKVEISDDTAVRPRADLQQGSMIKVIGQKESEARFKAQEIRPWQGKGRGMEGGNHNQNEHPSMQGGKGKAH